MSGSVSSSTSSSSSSSVTSGSTSDPLGSLSSNFDSFLQLLMTQRQNQDPSSPMDPDQFTSELVQFTSVEQQINTNSSLQQLIKLTQAGEVVQSTGMLGHQVEVQSNTMSLQSGTAGIQFTATAAGPAQIVVSDSSGNQLYATAVYATASSNSWTWNGQDSSGNQLPDGAYQVAVTQNGTNGSGTTLPVTIIGKVTGVDDLASSTSTSSGTSTDTSTGTSTDTSGVQLQLGSVPVDFSNIRAVLN